jgi:putative transposase
VTRTGPEESGRHSIRVKGYDYSQAGGYYITIVSSSREYLFGEVVESKMVLNRFGQIAKTQWERLPRRFHHIALGEFVVMPNHIHGIIFIVDGGGTAMDGCDIGDGRGTAVDGRGTAEHFEAHEYESSRRAPTDDESIRRAHIEQFGKPISGSIPTIVRSYKSAVALRVNLSRQTRDKPVWQRNYYEHIIRNQDDYERIAGYILDTPLRGAYPVNWNQDDENPAGKRNAPA